MYIGVYGLKGKYLGSAESFGEAKRMQEDALPEDLKEPYAGIHEGHPLFYSDLLTPELCEKYGLNME